MLTIEGIKGTLPIIHNEINLNLGHSGTTMRLIAAIAALSPNTITLDGSERLRQRPVQELLTVLEASGVSIEYLDNTHHLPVKIAGRPTFSDHIQISGNVSSQYISALLLIAPIAGIQTITIQKAIKSKPYIDITRDIMNTFGVTTREEGNTIHIPHNQHYMSQTYTIEGDYSSASYLFAAAAICQSEVTVTGLNTNSKQADRAFIDILSNMGCDASKHNNAITISGKPLHGITIDMSDCPDSVQTLCAVAAYAKGETRIKNIAHLRHKETDRISHTGSELRKMNINIAEKNDEIIINKSQPRGATIQTHNDHRMAMMATITGLKADGNTTIQNADVVTKSYPDFFNDMKHLGLSIEHENV